MSQNYFDYKKRLDEIAQERQPELKRTRLYETSELMPERIQAEANPTYLSFLDGLVDMWNIRQENEREEGNPLRDVKIVRQYSTDEDAEPNGIVYRMIHRGPSEEHREMDFRHKRSIPHPHREGEFIKIISQFFVVDIQFRVFSQKADDADFLVRDFSEFIRKYRRILTQSGVQHFRFMRQLADEIKTSHRGSYHIRPLEYRFYIEEFEYETEYEIKNIEILVSNYKNNHIGGQENGS